MIRQLREFAPERTVQVDIRPGLPAFRIVSGMLGPLGLLPDVEVLWLIGMASILATILWCLLLVSTTSLSASKRSSPDSARR